MVHITSFHPLSCASGDVDHSVVMFCVLFSLQQYVDEYEQEKFNYGERVKAYQNSPAYRQWLEMKQQGNVIFKELMMAINNFC